MIGFSETYQIAGSGNITTTDIDGNLCQFLYNFGEVQNSNYNVVGTRFSVFLEGKSPLMGFYANLIEFQGMLKVVLISNNYNPLYEKKGIPEVLIPEIGRVLKRAICSSSNDPTFQLYDGEQRVGEAEKYWERMLVIHPENVSYDAEKDIYIFNAVL